MDLFFFSCIVIVGVVIFCVSLFRHKMENFINYILKIFLGAVGIYSINYILALNGASLIVGLNGVNILTIGILGLPGLILIYSMGLFFYLV